MTLKWLNVNTLNVKLYNSQHNKLKSVIKNETEVTLNLYQIFNDETNFPHTLVLPDMQVSKFVELLQMVCQLI